jgi:hypothetical protein
MSASKKILILCTSADQLADQKTGAWSEEITVPFYTFKVLPPISIFFMRFSKYNFAGTNFFVALFF